MKNSITLEQIDNLLNNSEIQVNTIFEKCTLVSVKLPNDFILVESSACVDKNNYNEEMGKNICLDRIKNRLWELEGYKLQNMLKEENINE